MRPKTVLVRSGEALNQIRIFRELSKSLIYIRSETRTSMSRNGYLDPSKRQPPSMYTPPHWGELDQLEVQGALSV